MLIDYHVGKWRRKPKYSRRVSLNQIRLLSSLAVWKLYHILNHVNRGFIRDRKPIMCYTDLPVPMKRRRSELVAQAKTLRQEGNMTRIRVKDIDVILEFRDKSTRGPWKLKIYR